MSKNRNIFLEHKKTILQVTKANDAPSISVGANMAGEDVTALVKQALGIA